MKYLIEDLRRRVEGLDRRDTLRRVIVEHPGCEALVNVQAMPQDAFIGIVHADLPSGPLAKPLNHPFDIIANQMKHLDDLDLLIQ